LRDRKNLQHKPGTVAPKSPMGTRSSFDGGIAMQGRREVASTILSVFNQQQSRPGYNLPTGVIAALAERAGWTTDQLLTGIEYGYSVGWFVVGPKLGLHLTDAGFSQMVNGTSLAAVRAQPESGDGVNARVHPSDD
jgi:hypothetical protein